ncbi:mercury transporter MerT [Sulfurifustis variabilis]|uniref:Mercuric transport protein MerT n=1 Tax=Sulfurifustis variabilis TaxID=1675686 RepID=A0A1C7AEU9_9GAMM|nr:mercuric transporter MerT family protein [Sulfurifustis variabilis]BAU49700.1 mercury transporter MerT [Sulfurifustis variabilis]
MRTRSNGSGSASLVASLVAGIGASVCCVGPLVLLTAGVGGAWIANLTALEPFRPLFVGAALVFLGLSFRRLYLFPPACEPGTPCADPKRLRRQRAVFWIVTLPLLALLAFPWYAPLFY